MVVTRSMLQKKFAEVVRQTRTIQQNNHPNIRQTILEEEGTVIIEKKKITKIQGDYMITTDGTKAQLFNPIPCLHWKCLTTPNNKGIITLRTPLTGLFIDDGTQTYCIGITGHSDEFEIRIQIGTDEIRMNNTFLNITTPHLVINGLEAKTKIKEEIKKTEEDKTT